MIKLPSGTALRTMKYKPSGASLITWNDKIAERDSPLNNEI
jgi:hypothetical protein